MACYGHKHGDMGRDVVIGVLCPGGTRSSSFLFVGGARHLFELNWFLSAVRRCCVSARNRAFVDIILHRFVFSASRKRKKVQKFF